MGAEGAAPPLLIWALIFREVALYALRTIDADRSTNTKDLRWISLLFALIIRVYFLMFLMAGLFSLYGVSAPPSFYFLANSLGYAAVMVGYVGLVELMRRMPEAP